MWERKGPSGTRNEPPAADEAPAFITGAVPADWFTGAPQVTIDRDEIVIVGVLAAPTLVGNGPSAGGPTDSAPTGSGPTDSGPTEAERAAAERGRISTFREETRERRIRIAQQIEHRYQRKVAWGVACGGTRELFTSLSAPVMTRLRQGERQVLDTLVDSGVARSRSEALAWCVRLVGEHTDQWLSDLRTAMGAVDELRRRGPDVVS